jgi:hypothetical protein
MRRRLRQTGPPVAPTIGRRPGLPPRLTDWGLAAAAAGALLSGIVSLITGHADQWLVFALHGAAGLWLALLLWGKLRRVWPRLVRPRWWDRKTVWGAGTLLSVALVLGTGVWWVAGGDVYVAGFGLLNWHILFGFALGALLTLHMLARARPLRAHQIRGRRQVLGFGTLLVAGGVLWAGQQGLQRALALPGAARRFTGSRAAGNFTGNAFPTSSWVADQPRPIVPEAWHLTVDGAVAEPFTLRLDELAVLADALVATLDCTGGFYSSQRWSGVHVGRLLARAKPHPHAQWVSFLSITGYRWSLPLEEAAAALLATRVGDEALAHVHGAPLRLVAPGRRGFVWVKWLTRVEVRTSPDFGELVAIHTSWLTPAGRGEI